MLQRQVNKVTGLALFKSPGDLMAFQRRIIKRLNILNLKFLKSKIKKDENLFFQAKEVTNTFIADEYF